MIAAIKNYLRRFPFIFNIFLELYVFFFPIPESPIPKYLEEILGQDASVFFVQVGSNDGRRNDPIHDLVMKNEAWTGIFIEPVGFLFERLKQNYENSERFIFENIAIGIEKGTKEFYYVSQDAEAKLKAGLPDWYDGLGSFDRNHILKHLGGTLEPYIVEEKIECVPIQEVFDKYQVRKIDLIHIDTEGFDYKVLSQINFNRYEPSVVLYEHRHLSVDEKRKAITLLEMSGYSLFEFREDTLAIFNGLEASLQELQKVK